jgi:hypothetical protein
VKKHAAQNNVTAIEAHRVNNRIHLSKKADHPANEYLRLAK